MASNAAARENWLVLGFALALVAVAAVGAFAGPAGVWGVIGIGKKGEVKFRNGRVACLRVEAA